jgi:hypothetical protein
MNVGGVNAFVGTQRDTQAMTSEARRRKACL